VWENGESYGASQETMVRHHAQREALLDHPAPAGLAAPAAWRLWVDVLVAQPLGCPSARLTCWGCRHSQRMASLTRAGWCLRSRGKGAAVATILGYALLLRMDVPRGIPAMPEASSCETPAAHEGRRPLWPHEASAALDQTMSLPHGAYGHPQPTCVCPAHVVSSLGRSLRAGTTRSEEGHTDGSSPKKL
jgi:hypothetical protein